MPPELDLINEEEQIVHLIELNPEDGKPYDPETILSILFLIFCFIKFLDIFKYDLEFEKKEAEYEEIKKVLIGESSDEEEDDANSGEDDVNTELDVAAETG